MSQENVEIVKRILAANRSGPPEETREVALSLAAPEVEFRSRVMEVEGGEYFGHDGVRRAFDDMADAFRSWRNEAEAFAEVSPGGVLVDNVFHGIGKESGMEVELRSAILFIIREGRVTRCLSYSTRAEALEAAGLSE
jgi:ketosteroid isomerase-like protein